MKALQDLNNLRVALVHYWIVSHRGGERVLEVIADMFPNADLFTLVVDRDWLAPALRDRKLTTSFLQKIPGAKRHYQKLMPLYPLALEQFNLDDYDLVISQEAGSSKGVLTRAKTCHICYLHSPMRYIWDMYHSYRASAPGGGVGRAVYALTAHYLRLWDFAAAQHVDYFAASSFNGAARAGKHYGRTAEIIYPPVAVDEFEVATKPGEFYLVVSPLVAYKQVNLAVQACNRLARRLIVIGTGPESASLRALAGPTVTFLGRQSDEVVRDHYRRCRALLFAGEEDIGLTPIEAQASGRPVIAYGRGGALETVYGICSGDAFQSGATGIFFPQQSADSIIEAIEAFEAVEDRFMPAVCRANAERFCVESFKQKFGAYVAEKFFEFQQASQPRLTGAPRVTVSPIEERRQPALLNLR